MRRRFPRHVYEHGADPDPRFSLANERTFLAWIRTSLGLLAVGVALEALQLDLQPQLRTAASLGFLLLGAVLPWLAWRHWAASERAMRAERPLPSPVASLPLAVVITLVAVTLVGAVVAA